MTDFNYDEYLKISPTVDEVKLNKLKEIKAMGVNPYPIVFKKNINSNQLKQKYNDVLEAGEKKENDIYKIAGRLMFRRDMGKSVFLDINDEFGKIQVYVKIPDLEELQQKVFDKLDIGDFLGIEGYVFKTKTGELSIHCQNFTLLSKSIAPMPEKFHGLADLELRYRQRFVDMTMNPEVREVFKKRAIIIREIRNYLDNEGFIEVTTPTLQPIYGGANARPFMTHHNDLDMDLYMSIAPELYLKKLIAGGFEKVYDICKNFRNEGCDQTHNPEFTAIEWYEAYADYTDTAKRTETMIENIIKKINNGSTKIKVRGFDIDFKAPWRRLTVYDGLRQYANIEPTTISKEDLIKELSKYIKDVEPRKSKGELLLQLFEETCEKELIQPTFVMDYPVETSPLTKLHRSEKGLVERFEGFVAQKEICNAYSELNDPVDQGFRFVEQKRQSEYDDEAQKFDKNFLHSVEFGMPNMSGIGIGIDRLVMFLTGQESIRDVIAFPTMKLRKEDL